ncbi:MAG TPA: 4Fe-4S binding protein [Sedimentisphaerales bacterium]|nr:4Fe-4S binding protein [Sedimentisphaerales bacterium]HRS10441.1 4Fe-4S binding protein [Sedimentisphaerales bacterium]HRV47146.1 4Fe-4S binding protein [Sedimentisphaerales bacterium]
MAIRNIVKIDEEKCNGCGQCVTACAEGAIQIINGKAKLVSETYCDGLGACLGHCPQDAITIEQREAAEFDEEATKAHLAREAEPEPAFACPGLAMQQFDKTVKVEPGDAAEGPATPSRLRHWPVQLRLVARTAPYFADADLLLVADCVPFAMGDFHQRFLKGRSVAMGCPKLDDAEFYIEKLADILRANTIRSLTVVHMEVPCCSGLTRVAREAIARSGRAMGFEDVTVSLRGDVIRSVMVEVENGAVSRA